MLNTQSNTYINICDPVYLLNFIKKKGIPEKFKRLFSFWEELVNKGIEVNCESLLEISKDHKIVCQFMFLINDNDKKIIK
jgi:hypothetical protein